VVQKLYQGIGREVCIMLTTVQTLGKIRLNLVSPSPTEIYDTIDALYNRDKRKRLEKLAAYSIRADGKRIGDRTVLFVGQSNSGKTSISSRLPGDYFIGGEVRTQEFGIAYFDPTMRVLPLISTGETSGKVTDVVWVERAERTPKFSQNIDLELLFSFLSGEVIFEDTTRTTAYARRMMSAAENSGLCYHHVLNGEGHLEQTVRLVRNLLGCYS
jgi:hypothetical protein